MLHETQLDHVTQNNVTLGLTIQKSSSQTIDYHLKT
jgi:hypothetical protein